MTKLSSVKGCGFVFMTGLPGGERFLCTGWAWNTNGS